MRVFRRRALGLAIPLLALFSLPAHSQNLLLNPGFDRDLSGWELRTYTYPPSPPNSNSPAASATWDPAGVTSRDSGSAHFQMIGGYQTVNQVSLSQCLPVTPGRRYAGGGLIRTDKQYQFGLFVALTFYASAACSGSPVTGAWGYSLRSMQFAAADSGGRWLPASLSAFADAGIQSMLFVAGIDAISTSWAPGSYFDGLFDNAYLVEQSDPAATWILPSAVRAPGAGASVWMTDLTLASPGASDALVTLRFLGHDADGRFGSEKTVFVRAGGLLEYPDVLGTLFGRVQDYGAIRITSSSANLVVQSETSTPSMGGTVGQALPAFGSADYAGVTPKTLAPIRENATFRTNLVLANATESPVTAHVTLLAADGTQIGSRDVDLPPLGMTQINRVAAALGTPSLDAGRVSVSTPTPGGLVAAYASVIDNATNDPRTLLPQDAAPAPLSPNLLMNPGFDRDLSGWTVTQTEVGSGYGSAVWGLDDARGSAGSGSAALAGGGSVPGSGGGGSISQCLAVKAGSRYGLRAAVRSSGWGFAGYVPLPQLGFAFFDLSDCSGRTLAASPTANGPFRSTYEWSTYAVPAVTAPAGTRTALVTFEAGAGALVHGSGITASCDDVVFAEGESTFTTYVPAAASTTGFNGSRWTTTLTLSNAGSVDATVYIFGLATNVAAGVTVTLPDVVHDTLGLSQTWLPLRVLATSLSIVVTAETSSPSADGTVGQALAALTTHDLASATPKTIAPVRDDGAFRTNLVVANATSAPLVAHIDLFDAAGSTIGSRDVPLDAGAATQIGAVGWTLSGGSVEAGRISVSTATPGGLVAAYASVIDNTTNDPRTLLPR